MHSYVVGPSILNLFVDCIKFPLGKVRLFNLFPRIKRTGNYIQRLKMYMYMHSHVFCPFMRHGVCM